MKVCYVQRRPSSEGTCLRATSGQAVCWKHKLQLHPVYSFSFVGWVVSDAKHWKHSNIMGDIMSAKEEAAFSYVGPTLVRFTSTFSASWLHRDEFS